MSQLDDRKQRWLEAFGQVFTVTTACKLAAVSRATVYRWRREDEDFAVAWADIDAANVEELEVEARRRAVEGVVRPAAIAGERVDVREYSDQLLMFLLKARRPEVYRERHVVRHEKVADLNELTPEKLRAMSDEELAALQAQLAQDREAMEREGRA